MEIKKLVWFVSFQHQEWSCLLQKIQKLHSFLMIQIPTTWSRETLLLSFLNTCTSPNCSTWKTISTRWTIKIPNQQRTRCQILLKKSFQEEMINWFPLPASSRAQQLTGRHHSTPNQVILYRSHLVNNSLHKNRYFELKRLFFFLQIMSECISSLSFSLWVRIW